MKKEFTNRVTDEMDNSEDSYNVEKGIKTFIKWVQTGKMEMRIYPEAPIHAKVYIMRKDLTKAIITEQSLPVQVIFQNPDKLFSNELEKGRDADGILDIFDRFNFTMNEDEPLEKEVAVDPEMLGKIFENLLEPGDRKSKGAFYTPREIVHYICQESLINYLVKVVIQSEI